jgi:dipeptidyl aminopeptidase/acylaminoacyl peptidase
MKTRISGGGGEGGTLVALLTFGAYLGAPPLSPSFGDRVGAVMLLVALTVLPGLSQSPLTTTIKLQSRNLENMQNFTIEKLYMTRETGGTTWSPDGKQVAFISNISGRNNLWLVPSAGGWPTQLTISPQRQVQPAWSPDGSWIAYSSDYDGNELWDIFLVSPKTGEVVNLTTTKEISEQSPVWSADSKQVAYTAKAKDGASYEIDVIDVYTRHVRHVTQNTPANLSNVLPVFAHDGEAIAYTQVRADGKDANVFLFDLATGKVRNLTTHTGDHLYFASDLSPDGKTALITSDAHNGYWNIGLLDVASGDINWLTDEKWETRSGSFSPDGHAVCWTANVDGRTVIDSYDRASKQTQTLPLTAGVNTLAGNPRPYSPDGSKLLYYHQGGDSPTDAWTYDVATQQSQQVTHAFVGGLHSADMVQPVLVHYPSRDGKFTISAFVYVPNNITPNGKFPAIVSIHGGPASQFVDGFDPLIQYVVNQGYLVIAPNYRGSSGYGKEFLYANEHDLGGSDLNDVLDAAEWIKKSPFIDPKKLVVMGGSYGGYLTMMALTKSPEMWAAGIAIVPFVNWTTELANVDPNIRQTDIAIMGDPTANKDLYADRSPINFIDRIKAPLLLLAGANDARCPVTEAQQVAAAIKKNGGVVQLKIYEGEGHKFSRIETTKDAYQRVSDFLKVRAPSPGCGCSIYE